MSYRLANLATAGVAAWLGLVSPNVDAFSVEKVEQGGDPNDPPAYIRGGGTAAWHRVPDLRCDEFSTWLRNVCESATPTATKAYLAVSNYHGPGAAGAYSGLLAANPAWWDNGPLGDPIPLTPLGKGTILGGPWGPAEFAEWARRATVIVRVFDGSASRNWHSDGADVGPPPPIPTCTVNAPAVQLTTSPGLRGVGQSRATISCDSQRRVGVVVSGKGGGALQLGEAGLTATLTLNGAATDATPVYIDVPKGGTGFATIEVTVDADESVAAGKYKGVVKVVIDEP